MIRRLLERHGRGYRDVLSPIHTAAEFNARFPDDEACRDYLFRARFPDGYRCVKCTGRSYVWLTHKLFQCPHCRRKVSLTAGTILHGTRKSLRDWFRAAFLMIQPATSARTLEHSIQLTWKVAWTWAHKLRRVMGSKTTLDAPFPSFEAALATNRVRNTRVARRHWFLQHGDFRWAAHRPGGLGPCCQRLASADWAHPRPEERERWAHYRATPLVDEAKQRLFRAHSGCVSDKHLRAYLDETEFRLNRAGMKPVDAVMDVLARFAASRPCPYREITGCPDERSALWFSRPAVPSIPDVA